MIGANQDFPGWAEHGLLMETGDERGGRAFIGTRATEDQCRWMMVARGTQGMIEQGGGIRDGLEIHMTLRDFDDGMMQPPDEIRIAMTS
jgi:hypothetical protein